MSFVGDAWDDLTGKSAAKEARTAAGEQLGFQREALDYLKEAEAAPRFYRENALSQIAGIFGLPGFQGESPIGMEGFVSSLRDDPFYQANVEAGEEAILRNLSATGGLRSGTAQEALAENQQNVLQNIFQQRLGGLQGLANLPSNVNQIAQNIQGLGETTAQGRIAAANARQQGMGNIFSGIMSGLAAFSDPRLKKNIKVIGKFKGFDWCNWDWNEEAGKLGLKGRGVGLMADEIAKTHPEFTGKSNGYLVVHYDKLMEAA